jgi:hypothetical protein
MIYFFFGLVCANALPATDLVLALVRPSLSRDEALRATACDVCLLFFAMRITSFHWQQGRYLATFITDFKLHGTFTMFPQ